MLLFAIHVDLWQFALMLTPRTPQCWARVWPLRPRILEARALSMLGFGDRHPNAECRSIVYRDILSAGLAPELHAKPYYLSAEPFVKHAMCSLCCKRDGPRTLGSSKDPCALTKKPSLSGEHPNAQPDSALLYRRLVSARVHRTGFQGIGAQTSGQQARPLFQWSTIKCKIS